MSEKSECAEQYSLVGYCLSSVLQTTVLGFALKMFKILLCYEGWSKSIVVIFGRGTLQSVRNQKKITCHSLYCPVHFPDSLDTCQNLFQSHLTQLCAPGVTMVLVKGRKKNEIASKMILWTWVQKRGGIQSQILICKRNFWKISNGALGQGEVSDVIPLSLNSQGFCTDFAYSQLLRHTNISPTDSDWRKHLSAHFGIWCGAVRCEQKLTGHLENLFKILKKMLNVTFLEQEVTERAETSES